MSLPLRSKQSCNLFHRTSLLGFFLLVDGNEVFQLSLSAKSPIHHQAQASDRHLKPQTIVERSVLAQVGQPGKPLFVTHPGLGLGNCPTTDAMRHEFVPHNIGGGQFFGLASPVPFTSLIAEMNTVARPVSSW